MGVKESNSYCARKTRKRDRHISVLQQNKMHWDVRVITSIVEQILNVRIRYFRTERVNDSTFVYNLETKE